MIAWFSMIALVLKDSFWFSRIGFDFRWIAFVFDKIAFVSTDDVSFNVSAAELARQAAVLVDRDTVDEAFYSMRRDKEYTFHKPEPKPCTRHSHVPQA